MPLLAAAAAAGGACSAATTCTACAAVLDHGCFWCYDSGACMALQYPTSKGGVLHGCHNFSLTAPDCACNEFKTCAECATPAHIAHPACEWTNTSTNLTIHGPKWIGVSTLSLGHRVGCRVAGGAGAFTGPDAVTHNQSISLPGLDPISIAIVEYPTRWYWAQCNVEGPAFAGVVIIGGILLALGLLCFARCVCRRCCCKRRRSAWVDADQLLSVQSIQPNRFGAVQAVRPVRAP